MYWYKCYTAFEHVRGNSKNQYIRDHMKEYGKASSIVIQLCKKAHIQGTRRNLIAGSLFLVYQYGFV